MNSQMVGGLGAGILQGLDTVRTRRRQDESDDMRRESHDMRKQQFGLQMEGARLGNEQKALNLDYTQQVQPYKMRQMERQDASGERQAEAERIANLSHQAFQAFQSRDFDAVNEHLAEINPDNPTPPMLLPPTTSGDPSQFTFRMNGQDQDMSAKDFAQMLQSRASPAGALEALAKVDEQSADWRRLNEGGLYNQRTGEIKGARGIGGAAGGSSYGGMKPVDWNRLDARNTAFFGKLDEAGQIILDGDAKFQKDEANTRTMQLIDANVPAWQAEIIARASVGGTSSGAEVRRAAEGAAAEEGLRPGEERYDAFISNYLKESDATGRQEAEAMYRNLVGGGQPVGLGMAQPGQRGGGRPEPGGQRGMQTPGSSPQAGAEPEVVRTGTTSDGRRVGQLADGRVIDLATGQEVR